MKRPGFSYLLAGIVLLGGCATTVDMDERNRVAGLENGVRVDANFYGLVQSGRTASISLVYEIENRRDRSVAFAEMVPISSFDSETGTFTVIVGSEVPGQEMLPRLIEIKPGERVSLTAGARLVVPPVDPEFRGKPPGQIQLKVVFLEDVEPFRELVGISEVAISDAKRADELFLPWVESTLSVTTNAVPLRRHARASPAPDRSAARP